MNKEESLAGFLLFFYSRIVQYACNHKTIYNCTIKQKGVTDDTF